MSMVNFLLKNARITGKRIPKKNEMGREGNGWEDQGSVGVCIVFPASRCVSFFRAKDLVDQLRRKLKTFLTIIVKKTKYVSLLPNFDFLLCKPKRIPCRLGSSVLASLSMLLAAFIITAFAARTGKAFEVFWLILKDEKKSP